MNDISKLLELAAKALGIELRYDPHGKPRDCTNQLADIFSAPLWNPADDDGDCARMEAALSMQVDMSVLKFVEVWCAGYLRIEHFSAHNNDRQAARRMASLRAAAAIGETMK
jgi:hypothetical protein